MKIVKPITNPTATNEKKLCGCGNVVLCKGMCNACYKYHRYHSLKNAPTEEKKNCECGNVATCKGMCNACYQKSRTCECGKVACAKGMCSSCYVKSRYKLDIDYAPIYKKVLSEVKKGSTISAALKFLKINKFEFYSNITAQQKREINEFKIIYSSPRNPFFEDLD